MEDSRTAGVGRPERVGRLVLVGHPVAHSLSPAFQNAALVHAGLALRYEPIDVAPVELAAVLRTLRAQAGAGNVTIPHKRAVAAACDVLTPLARAVGAVNTFWCAGGALVGDNTDVAGARAALGALVRMRNADRATTDRAPVRRVALIGAGGAAAALVCAVTDAWPDGEVRIWSRRREQAARLAAALPGRVVVADTPRDALGGADVVVNATPLGLDHGDPLPCAVPALPDGAAVFDMVYGPRETAWVRAAREAGHAAQDGIVMLVEQGAHAFERWFGRAPDRGAMWAAVCERTGRGCEVLRP